MGYFIIIIFGTFMSSSPEFLPIAFKNGKDCENYLTTKVIDKYFDFRLENTENTKYLVNSINNKFVLCKKLEYPLNQDKLLIIKK